MAAPQLVLIASALLAALLAIRGHYLQDSQRWLVYLFKPLATLLILALVLTFPSSRPEYQWAIAAGLFFSTAGDIFLMLPEDRFIAGLSSFLVAHLCYAYGFSLGVPFGTAFLFWPPYFMVGGIVVALVWPGLKPALRGPVMAYVAVIAVMAGQATGRWHALGGAVALLAAAGAALFIISDAVLAIDRFRWHFRAARAVTLGTYWSAQLLIALSV